MLVFRYILIAVFILLLWTPLIGMFSEVDFGIRLSGVVPRKKKVDLNYENFTNYKYQDYLDFYLRRHSNFYGFLIRSENQITYDFFRQIGPGYKAHLILGNDNYLFQKAYLENHNNTQEFRSKYIRRHLKLFERSKEILNKHGVEMLIFINSNKVALYPEIVPSRYQVAKELLKPGFYELAKNKFNKFNLDMYDAHDQLESIKDRRMLFAPSSSHYNEYGNCLVTKGFLQSLSKAIDTKLPELYCELGTESKSPIEQDLDLAEVTNLWRQSNFHENTPRTLSSIEEVEYVKPKVLFVGTSFFWGILPHFDRHSIFQERDFLYYFKRLHKKSGKVVPDFQCNAEKIQEYFLDFDAIILEVNQANLHQLSHGFFSCLEEFRRKKK